MKPRIFAALATYNGERFLPEMLRSLCQVTRPLNRIIAIDDASSDATVSILESFQEKLPLQIIRRTKNGGHRIAFSDAFHEIQQTASPEDFVAILDQDDICIPEKFSLLENALEENPAATLAFGDACVIDENGKQIASSWRKLAGISSHISTISRLCGTNNVNGCLSLFRASLLPKILPIPDWIPVYDEWISLCAAKSGNILAIENPVLNYRLHGKNSIGLGPQIAMSQSLKINIRVSNGLLQSAKLLTLTPEEIAFVSEYKNFLERSLSHSCNFHWIPWLWKNQCELYPGCSASRRLKKIFGASLGFPFCKRFLGKN